MIEPGHAHATLGSMGKYADPLIRKVLLVTALASIAPDSALSQLVPQKPDLFVEVRNFAIPQLQFGAAAWGDYDGDGDFDLFLTGILSPFDRPDPVARFYRNNRNYTREEPDPEGGDEPIEVPATDYEEVSSHAGLWRSAVAWGDSDNDGDLDLLATGLMSSGDRVTVIYENAPDQGQFSTTYMGPGVSDGAIAWGDFDNDGDLDFVQSGENDAGDYITELYENLLGEGGGFVWRPSTLVGLSQSSLSWGDFDNDQDLDLLLAGLAQNGDFITRLYRNSGNGFFSDSGITLDGLLYPSVAWGDMEGDGDLDILLSGARLDPIHVLEADLQIYVNNGGTFSTDGVTIRGPVVFTEELGLFMPAFGRYQGSAAWGDYNNDGFLDFLLSGEKRPGDAQTGQIYMYNLDFPEYYPLFTADSIGRDNGTFVGGLNGTSFWGDYDNDNDLDVFVLGLDPRLGTFTGGLQNYLDDYPPNVKPQRPSNLTAVTSANRVELFWSPGMDSATPTPGLTYNVRVGTAPLGVDILSPMATPETGYRLLSAYGNVQHNLGWRLINLAPGTYYWSVQSIDSSFKGSRFAPERVFVIE